MSQMTNEQELIVETILMPNINFLKVNAISGAGKTSTLVEIAKALKPKSGKYLAYNKAIATEASQKFPSAIECSTVHSMAYQATVKPFRMKVGFMRAKDIKDRIAYTRKIIIFDLLEKFFLSEYITIDDYIDSLFVNDETIPNISEEDVVILKEQFRKMKDKEMDCTHGFYLKLFHMMLAHGITNPDKEDLIMLDEAGDINPVTLEIFKLLKADKKIMVGDNNQNIYSFNNTINGFEKLKDEGVLLNLSQSFRVSDKIAKHVEPFCHAYLEPDMVFKGVEYNGVPNIETTAYIARTNSAIIGQMIELDRKRRPYNLTRPVYSLFELPLTLMYLSPGKTVQNPQYKFLEDDMNEYYDNSAIQQQYPSLMGYIMSEHNDDIAIKSACNLITKYGRKTIKDTYDNAKAHEGEGYNYPITLTTAHSSKGLEYDEVFVLEDMNEKIDDILEEFEPLAMEMNAPLYEVLPNKVQEEFRLYYVLCTRAKHILHNARHLIGAPITIE